LKYQRINHLFGNIRFDNHPKIHRSYHYGEIVHGVNEGDSTETIVNKKIIYINRIVTPIGPVLVGAVDEGICMLEFTDRHSLENQLEVLEKHFDAVLTPGKNKHFIQLAKELDEYFEGKRKEFDVAIIFPGTPFQENVWDSLTEIPYGQTRSYKEQSIVLKNPKAIRAIAHANGENRISIVVPCHRIIGSDGDLVGYGGGLWRKRFLLDLENPGQTRMEF
jgi:AraC family transcriptional regulator of adaptative response/methylated-DNA-[protein]-cysteine methyltransferase